MLELNSFVWFDRRAAQAVEELVDAATGELS
jgi:hypothetical protein